jgi:hypothetical protein
MRKTGVDLRAVLGIVNAMMAAGSVAAYALYGANRYVDLNTIVLSIVLSLQTHVALLLNKKRQDPFVIILAFTMIFFYSLRIGTLSWHPYSSAFERFPFKSTDLNYGLR